MSVRAGPLEKARLAAGRRTTRSVGPEHRARRPTRRAVRAVWAVCATRTSEAAPKQGELWEHVMRNTVLVPVVSPLSALLARDWGVLGEGGRRRVGESSRGAFQRTKSNPHRSAALRLQGGAPF